MVVFKLIGIIICWFLIGTIINIVLYSGLPVSEQRETKQGHALHIILNILTIIVIMNILFNKNW